MSLRTLFKEKSDRTHIQLIKYGFVGACAYSVDFGALILLTERFGIHYLISAAIAFLLGLAANYFLSIRWVFSTRTLQSKKMEFLIFSIIGMVGLAFNEIFIWFFTEITDFHYIMSKFVATGFVFFWNFIARKKMLFS